MPSCLQIFEADGAAGMDVMVLACTHFPLLAEEIAAAYPGIAQVDGGPGIARRISHLTRGQEWPDDSPDGVAVFTAEPSPALTPALARFGLREIKTL